MFCGPLTSTGAGCCGEEEQPLVLPPVPVSTGNGTLHMVSWSTWIQPREREVPLLSSPHGHSKWHWTLPEGSDELSCSRGGCCAWGCHWCLLCCLFSQWGVCVVGMRGKLSLFLLSGNERLMWWDRRLPCSIGKQPCFVVNICTKKKYSRRVLKCRCLFLVRQRYKPPFNCAPEITVEQAIWLWNSCSRKAINLYCLETFEIGLDTPWCSAQIKAMCFREQSTADYLREWTTPWEQGIGCKLYISLSSCCRSAAC